MRSSRDVDSVLPNNLLTRTRRLVCGFGLFQFLWPILVSPITGTGLRIDLLAIIIAGIGFSMRADTFRRFPWTALLFVGYPLVFLNSCWEYSVTDMSNWIPARFSPNLGLQLVSSVWATVAASWVVKCHRYHRNAVQSGRNYAVNRSGRKHVF